MKNQPLSTCGALVYAHNCEAMKRETKGQAKMPSVYQHACDVGVSHRFGHASGREYHYEGRADDERRTDDDTNQIGVGPMIH